MAGFFRYDSKFSQGLNKAIDIVVLSVLWIFTSLPIFTIGASTTALFTASRQVLRENKGYTYKNYFAAFKSNFKQSTGMWLILLALIVVLTLDREIMIRVFLPTGSSLGSLYIVFTILLYYVMIWAVYIFAYASRFELNFKGIMKNSAILSIMNLPWSLLMAAMIVGGTWLVQNISPIYAFAFPALFGWIFTIILERIFKKIMTEEDLEKVLEEERLTK